MKSKLKDFLLKCKSFLEVQGAERIIFTVLSLCLLSALIAAGFYISYLHQAKSELEHRKDLLKNEISTLEEAEGYDIRMMNVTKYAPLDSAAIAGWDFAGDREITASGEEVVPGKTAAAGPNIPFGTEIYVEGKGWYTVKDRGGRIGTDEIDLTTESKEASQEWGIQERLVIIDTP